MYNKILQWAESITRHYDGAESITRYHDGQKV